MALTFLFKLIIYKKMVDTHIQLFLNSKNHIQLIYCNYFFKFYFIYHKYKRFYHLNKQVYLY